MVWVYAISFVSEKTREHTHTHCSVLLFKSVKWIGDCFFSVCAAASLELFDLNQQQPINKRNRTKNIKSRNVEWIYFDWASVSVFIFVKWYTRNKTKNNLKYTQLIPFCRLSSFQKSIAQETQHPWLFCAHRTFGWLHELATNFIFCVGEFIYNKTATAR